MSAWSPKSYILKGSLILILGFGGFVAWATQTQIAGSVTTSGQVEVEARKQSVQHPDGGRIAEIHVREGRQVAQGAPLLRLDGVELEAQRAILLRPLYETWAGLDRYRAETRGDARVLYREELRAAAQDPEIAEALESETRRFEERRAALEQTLAQLDARRQESEARIAGDQNQMRSKQVTLASLRDDLERKRHLQSRGFGTQDPVAELHRQISETEGEFLALQSSVAQAMSVIAGLEAEALRIKAEWREAAQREMRALQPREAEYREQLRLIDTKIERLVLRAPMAGQVLGLRAHTEGGVIGAGAEVAAIVPADAPLILQVRIEPVDIDRVHVGQEATLRFPNFNARITPEAPGRVERISADALEDPATKLRFFTAELKLEPGAEEILQGKALTPGMPVEAFLRTDVRTPASFLFKPVTDYFAYAMREE